MENYEIRLYRTRDHLRSAWSTRCFVQCTSDQDALAIARRALNNGLLTATVWRDDRQVGELLPA